MCEGNFWGKHVLIQAKKLFLQFQQEKFGRPATHFQQVLSTLHSTCPEELLTKNQSFERNLNLRKVSDSEQSSTEFVEKVSARLTKPNCTCLEDLRNVLKKNDCLIKKHMSFFLNFERDSFDFLANYFRPCCQNWINVSGRIFEEEKSSEKFKTLTP